MITTPAPSSTPRPWLLAAFIAAALLGCAEDPHSAADPAADLSDGADPSADLSDGADPLDTLDPTDGSDASGCVPTVTLLEERVWPFMSQTCFACHGNQGIGAQGSDLDLIAATQPADHAKNLATLRAVAAKRDAGTSVLLLKPTGLIPHGGGTQILEDGPEYAALSDLVSRFDAPAPCDEDPNQPDAVITSLELSANVAAVRVGRVLPLSVFARNGQGALLPLPDDLTLSSSDPAIARVDAPDRIRGVAEGRVTLTAQAGDVRSPPLTIDVTPGSALGDADLRVSPSRVVLSPGDLLDLSVEVRDADGVRVLDPDITWRSLDPAVADLSAAGVLSALTVGQTSVVASFEGADSLPVPVLVTLEDAYLAVDITAPSGDTSATASLLIDADVQWLFPSSPNTFGTPVSPDSAVALIDGAFAADLDPHFFGATGSLDLSAYADGPHLLEVEAEADGQRVRSPAITLLKAPAPEPAWQDLGRVDAPTWETVYGPQSRLWTVDGTLYSATNQCGRECSLRLLRFDEANNRWGTVQYKQRHFVQVSGALEERVVDRDNIDLPRYVGWGWVSTSAREAHTPSDINALTIAWSDADARSSFNTEDEPQSYWNDCYVARWDDAAGYGGEGGWRLLSSEDPTWQDEPPHPSELPAEPTEQRFPAGADAVRTEDCRHPKLGVSGPDHLLAFVSTPIPDNDWKLRLRRWSNDAWLDAAAPLPLAPEAVLHDMRLDDSGRPIIAIDQGGSPGRVLRLDGGSWQPLGVSPPTVALALLDDATLIAASVERGVLSVHAFRDARWEPLGRPLNVSTWAEASNISLTTQGDRLAVAWAEGPDLGSSNVFAAAWHPATSSWEVIGAGSFEVVPDDHAVFPEVLIDPAGHLIVRYAAPNDPTADQQGGARAWIQRVRRSLNPVY
jgi:hypothetical protein